MWMKKLNSVNVKLHREVIYKIAIITYEIQKLIDTDKRFRFQHKLRNDISVAVKKDVS